MYKGHLLSSKNEAMSKVEEVPHKDHPARLQQLMTALGPSVIAAVVAVMVVVLTGQVEARRTDAVALREFRSTTYSSYLDALNEYASHQQTRADECVPGTDRPVGSQSDCTVSVQDLQAARFAYQGAVNDMYIYGSDEALALVKDIAALLPTATTVTGPPEEGGINDVERYSSLFGQFIDLMREDVAPPSS
jgi:hypothetical protein